MIIPLSRYGAKKQKAGGEYIKLAIEIVWKSNLFLHLLWMILCENKLGYARKQKFQKLTKPETPRKTKKCEGMQQW